MTTQPTRRAGRRGSVRRGPGRKGVLVGAAAVVAALVAGGTVVLTSSAGAASLGAVYSRTSAWDGGYTGQYLVTNPDAAAIEDWTLSFDLPAGAKIDSLWNAAFTADGQHVTVRPEAWSKRLEPGKSVVVGFVAQGAGAAQGEPSDCLIDNVSCKAGDGTAPTPSGRPTTTPTAAPTATASATPSATAVPTATQTVPPTAKPTTPAPTPTPTVTPTATGVPVPPVGAGAGFAPFVATSLHPPYDLLATVKASGVKNFNLAFVVSGVAPDPQGRMGEYAVAAATATQAQVKSVLGLDDAAAWRKVAVTPMIGVNDVAGEVFTVADAEQLADFAAAKHLAWLSMWSATRDKACPGGARPTADATCSSVVQQPLDFSRALGAYAG
ncbi:cellulose binding domain-containing protein [Kitasatospora sp. NPDC056783]|uniref:cellulose binding domain-containing protein n=1 Tax=Kitasatospora sp. NPDC056783 TaxID=3345943 RepID=UPI0036AB2069